MKTTFTREEVEDILREVYDRYEISNTSKFLMNNLSGYQDEPPWEKVADAQESEIQSYLY